MKKTVLMAMMLCVVSLLFAKNLRVVVVTTSPVMHCESCENTIKSNLRFEKGVKKIVTSLPDQTVTITYDADKNSAKSIAESFQKFGYTAQVLSDSPLKPKIGDEPKK